VISKMTKEWIQKYFGPIKKGAEIVRSTFVEEPITQLLKQNLKMLTFKFQPSMKTRDARVLI
jgi:hypothetical protein